MKVAIIGCGHTGKRMRRLLGSLLSLGATVIVVSGCKVTKTQQSSMELSEAIEQVRLETVERTLVVEEYGGILKGVLPLPTLSDLQDGDTLYTVTESEGIKLNLAVTNKGVTYVAEVEPTARSRLTEKVKTDTETKSKTDVSVKKETTKERSVWFPGLPIMIIGILGVIALLVLRLLKFI